MAKSDVNLIKGAYTAAGGGIKDLGLAGSKALTKISDKFMDVAVDEVESRSSEFEDYMNFELEKDPGLNEQEYKAKYEELMSQRSRFILGDNITRGEMLREMKQYNAQVTRLDDAKKDLVEGAKEDSDFLKGWGFSPEARAIGKQLKNGKSVMHNGKLGYFVDIPGFGREFYAADDLDNIREQYSFDQTSSDVLLSLAAKAKEEGNRVALMDFNQYKPFDFETTYKLVKSNLTNRGSIHSLATHEIGTNVFKDDLINYLSRKTYSDLGVQTPTSIGRIPSNVLKKMDPTKGDDMITPKDAKIIFNNLMADKSLARKTLTNYYTAYVENQYNSSFPRENINQNFRDRGGFVYFDLMGREVPANDPSAVTKAGPDGKQIPLKEISTNTDYAE